MSSCVLVAAPIQTAGLTLIDNRTQEKLRYHKHLLEIHRPGLKETSYRMAGNCREKLAKKHYYWHSVLLFSQDADDNGDAINIIFTGVCSATPYSTSIASATTLTANSTIAIYNYRNNNNNINPIIPLDNIIVIICIVIITVVVVVVVVVVVLLLLLLLLLLIILLTLLLFLLLLLF